MDASSCWAREQFQRAQGSQTHLAAGLGPFQLQRSPNSSSGVFSSSPSAQGWILGPVQQLGQSCILMSRQPLAHPALPHSCPGTL